MGRPETRAANSASKIAFFQSNPDARRERAERGKRDFHRTLGTPQAKAAAIRPEIIAKRAKTYSDNRLAWCPEEKRDEYRHLLYVKQVGSAEAKRIVLASIARETAALTPFERQLQAIRNGAGIREVRPIRRAASTFSETGLSQIYEYG
jgi:hypothetical protein